MGNKKAKDWSKQLSSPFCGLADPPGGQEVQRVDCMHYSNSFIEDTHTGPGQNMILRIKVRAWHAMPLLWMCGILLLFTHSLSAQGVTGKVAGVTDGGAIAVAMDSGRTVEPGTEGLVFRIFEFRGEGKKIEYAKIRVEKASGSECTCAITEKLIDREITAGLLVEFRVARTLSLSTPGSVEERAREYYTKNDLKSALELYRRALQINPFNAEAKQMIEKIKQEIETGGSQGLVSKIEYWTDKAQAASDAGNFDEAVTAYTNALKLDPENASLYVNRGISYRKSNRLRNAVEDYTKAIELQPNEIAYLYRGMAYSLQNKYQNATADFEKALSINPTLAEAYFQMGNTYVKTGDYEKAKKALGKYLEMEPQGKNAEEAKRLLNTI